MKALLAAMILAFATPSIASTTVLDPGNGRQYLTYWCGGQDIDEVAEGFNPDGTISALLSVYARCSGSGRGSGNVYHRACWRLTFDRDGAILAREFLGSGTWRQRPASPAFNCPFEADPTERFTDETGAKLYTITTTGPGAYGYAYRAVLETPTGGPSYAWTDPGTVEAAGGTETSFDLTFTNNGDAPLHVYSGDAYMTSAGGSIQATALTCWQADLAVGDSCTLTLRFVDYEDRPSGGDLFSISVALYTDAPYEELPVMIHTNWP